MNILYGLFFSSSILSALLYNLHGRRAVFINLCFLPFLMNLIYELSHHLPNSTQSPHHHPNFVDLSSSCAPLSPPYCPQPHSKDYLPPHGGHNTTTSTLSPFSTNPFKGNSFSGNRPLSVFPPCVFIGPGFFPAPSTNAPFTPVARILGATPEFSLFSSFTLTFRRFCCIPVIAAKAPVEANGFRSCVGLPLRMGDVLFGFRTLASVR